MRPFNPLNEAELPRQMRPASTPSDTDFDAKRDRVCGGSPRNHSRFLDGTYYLYVLDLTRGLFS
jgi:hypothetical protein